MTDKHASLKVLVTFDPPLIPPTLLTTENLITEETDERVNILILNYVRRAPNTKNILVMITKSSIKIRF